MKTRQQLHTDVLIVGAGGAGLRAALAAAEAGSSVLVVNKGPIGKSGITLVAAGGMQAPLHPEDSPEQYFADVVNAGYGLGDQNLIRVLSEDAVDRVADLERYGVGFVRKRDTNAYSLGHSPGQSNPRNIFIKGGGIGLVAALVAACRRNEKITLMDDFFVTGLIKGVHSTETVIGGAIGLNLKSGAVTLIKAKAVVMATGGCQQLWEVNDCPSDATGEGVANAYQIGAELVDMEMVLFYPSVIIWPPSLKGAFVHYEFLTGELLDGNIYDKDGIAVLTKPLQVRDQAMRVMAEAINDGRGGEHGGLYWYVGKEDQAAQKVLNTSQYDYIRAHGVNPATDKIEVAPGAHYLLGGIAIDDQCRTSVRGLFATPECAGNFDGANRLAGNGITGTQVFGARAGASAHQHAAVIDFTDFDQESLEAAIGRLDSKITVEACPAANVASLRKQLRTAIQQYAGVIRNEEGLKKLLGIIQTVKEALRTAKVPAIMPYNQPLVELLQLENMCELAELVAGCALKRQESRGHHFRSDFPTQNNPAWLKHTLVMKQRSGPAFGEKPIVIK